MKRLPQIALLALAAGPASAGPTLTLQGLFCNTEAQIDVALDLLEAGTPAALALASLNAAAPVCTQADLIAYVVSEPVALGRAGSRGAWKYRAQLVGVQVGDRLRPVTPSTAVYFFRARPLQDASEEA